MAFDFDAVREQLDKDEAAEKQRDVERAQKLEQTVLDLCNGLDKHVKRYKQNATVSRKGSIVTLQADNRPFRIEVTDPEGSGTFHAQEDTEFRIAVDRGSDAAEESVGGAAVNKDDMMKTVVKWLKGQ